MDAMITIDTMVCPCVQRSPCSNRRDRTARSARAHTARAGRDRPERAGRDCTARAGRDRTARARRAHTTRAVFELIAGDHMNLTLLSLLTVP